MKLAHLGIRSRGEDVLPAHTEILAHVQLVPQGGILVHYTAALHRVEDLGGVEGEHGCVPEAGSADADLLDPKGVSRIVDDFQIVLLRNGLNGAYVTERPIDMNRNNRRGLRRNQRFDLFRIQRIGLRIDVAEYRLAPATHDGVGGGGKTRGRGDDLSCQPKGRQDPFQSQMPIGKQGHIFRTKVPLQHMLQGLVLLPLIGQPPAVPERGDFVHVLFHGRKSGTGDINHFPTHQS